MKKSTGPQSRSKWGTLPATLVAFEQLQLPHLFASHGGEIKISVVPSLCEPLRKRVDGPETLACYWHETIARAPWYDEQREMSAVICLNIRLDIMSFALVGIGTLNECIVHPREVFRPAIATNAYGVALLHNHPSGNTSPSPADKELTRQLKSCGDALRIPLIDHVIVAAQPAKLYSFMEGGFLPERGARSAASEPTPRTFAVQLEMASVAAGGGAA